MIHDPRAFMPTESCKEQLQSQTAVIDHYRRIKETDGMLPTLSGWTARTPNEAKHYLLPSKYKVSVLMHKVVLAFSMTTLEVQEKNVIAIANDFYINMLVAVGAQSTFLGWLGVDAVGVVAGILVQSHLDVFEEKEFLRSIY